MVAAGGTFSLSLDFDVCTSGACPDGDYAVQVTATDALGNVSAPFAATVTVDRSNPPAPLVDALPAATRLNQLTVTGTAEPGATVRVLVQGTGTLPVPAPVIAADGTFSVVIDFGGGCESASLHRRRVRRLGGRERRRRERFAGQAPVSCGAGRSVGRR